MKRHIAIYVRVSSKNQSLRSQLPDLKRWSGAQDDTVRFYHDTFTGRSMNRPGWNLLETAISSGKVSTLVVWRIDRLGRTAKGLTALFDDLCEQKVNLVSLKDGLDLSTSAGRLMANVLASIAQFETEIRAERVMAGQAAARASGQRWGGSKKGRRKATRTQSKMILRMKDEGESVVDISKAVGLSRPTVYKVLYENTGK